jgi:hypothetical protein
VTLAAATGAAPARALRFGTTREVDMSKPLSAFVAVVAALLLPAAALADETPAAKPAANGEIVVKLQIRGRRAQPLASITVNHVEAAVAANELLKRPLGEGVPRVGTP